MERRRGDTLANFMHSESGTPSRTYHGASLKFVALHVRLNVSTYFPLFSKRVSKGVCVHLWSDKACEAERRIRQSPPGRPGEGIFEQLQLQMSIANGWQGISILQGRLGKSFPNNRLRISILGATIVYRLINCPKDQCPKPAVLT